jgi:hypothetical protein
MFFRDSHFCPSRISDPGTRFPDPATAIKENGGKKCVRPFLQNEYDFVYEKVKII